MISDQNGDSLVYEAISNVNEMLSVHVKCLWQLFMDFKARRLVLNMDAFGIKSCFHIYRHSPYLPSGHIVLER